MNCKYSLVSWEEIINIISSSFEAGKAHSWNLFKYLENNIPVEKWSTLPNWLDWQGREDIDILNRTVNIDNFSTGFNYVISEVSYREEMEPFNVSEGCLDWFVKNHRSEFGECFYNGEILIINIQKRYLYVLIDDGIYVNISFDEVERSTGKKQEAENLGDKMLNKGYYVKLKGWREGIKIIALVKMLKKYTGLGLAESKRVFDNILIDEEQIVEFFTKDDAIEFSEFAKSNGIVYVEVIEKA